MVNVITPTFKSIEVENKRNEVIRINVGDEVKFDVVETGEVKQGILLDISKVSKKGKFSITIKPNGATNKEVWEQEDIATNSLELV
jgi:protein involved in polysaccharide export with SLBB domain